MIHRDLHPGNIVLFFDIFGAITFKIIDFDKSKPLQGISGTGVPSSKIHNSPERCQIPGFDRILSEATDFWSVGMIAPFVSGYIDEQVLDDARHFEARATRAHDAVQTHTKYARLAPIVKRALVIIPAK